MPRDSSGNYSLPPGNPVAAGTVIDVAWANPTMSDIAVQLNGVVTRDGLLYPTAPMGFADGTPANPGIKFTASPATGFYSPSSNVIGVSIAGTPTSQFKAGQFLTLGGTAALPGIGWLNFGTTGFFNDGGNNVFATTLGVCRGGFKNVPGFHVGDIITDGPSSGVGFYNRARISSALITQYGLLEQTMFSNSATGACYGIYVDTRYADGSPTYITPSYHGIRITAPTLGTGQTLQALRGVLVDDMTGTTTTHGLYLGTAIGTSKWAVYALGGARSYFEGAVGVGIDPDTAVKLHVRKTVPAASPTWQTIDTAVFQGTTSSIVHAHAGATGGTLGFGFTVAGTRNKGGMLYTTSSDTMLFYTNSTIKWQLSEGAGAVLNLDLTGQAAVFSSSVQAASLNITPGQADVAGNLRVGGGAYGKLGVVDGGSPGVAPNGSVDGIVLESDGNTGISILGLAGATQQIRFGRFGSNAVGGFVYAHSSDTLSISANGTVAAFSAGLLAVTGALTVTTNATITGDLTAANVKSGTYTPTGTVGANVSAVSNGVFTWMRVGDTVTVSGRTTPTFTSTDNVAFWDLSLPVASAMSSINQLNGVGAPQSASGFKNVATIYGNATNDRATLSVRTENTAAQPYTVIFSYQVI